MTKKTIYSGKNAEPKSLTSHLMSFITFSGEITRKEFFIKAFLLILGIQIISYIIGGICTHSDRGFFNFMIFIPPCLGIYPLFCLISQYYRTKKIYSIAPRIFPIIWITLAWMASIILAYVVLFPIIERKQRVKDDREYHVNDDRGSVVYVWAKIFNKSTRVNRGEYWCYMFCSTMLYAPLLIGLAAGLAELEDKRYITGSTIWVIVGIVFLFLVYIPHKILLSKRVQDTNTSSGIVGVSIALEIGSLIAWKYHVISLLIMWSALSVINFALFILAIVPGTNGPNRFGEPTMDCSISQPTVKKTKNTSSKMESLEKLFSLKEKGILTDKEFKKEKAKLLSGKN